MEQPQQQPEQQPRDVKWTSPEILGEVFLLAIVLIFAITYLVELPGLRMPARWLPIITIAFATPFFIIRVRTLMQRKKWLQGGQIMDLGFRFGGDPAAERRRAARYVAAVGVLFLGLGLIGFHIFLPLWVMAYLFIFQKRMNIIAILIIGVAFEGFLLGVHDFIIDVLWPEPWLWQWLGIEYVFNDWPIDDTY